LAFLRDLVERSVEPQPEGFGVLEEPGLFRSLHARLDPLDQRLLLLSNERPDVDARKPWDLQRSKVQPGRRDACAEQPASGRR
jgi:hypothetical protein